MTKRSDRSQGHDDAQGRARAALALQNELYGGRPAAPTIAGGVSQ